MIQRAGGIPVGRGVVHQAELYYTNLPVVELVPGSPHKTVVEVFDLTNSRGIESIEMIESAYHRDEVTVHLDSGTTTQAWLYNRKAYSTPQSVFFVPHGDFMRFNVNEWRQDRWKTGGKITNESPDVFNETRTRRGETHFSGSLWDAP